MRSDIFNIGFVSLFSVCIHICFFFLLKCIYPKAKFYPWVTFFFSNLPKHTVFSVNKCIMCNYNTAVAMMEVLWTAHKTVQYMYSLTPTLCIWLSFKWVLYYYIKPFSNILPNSSVQTLHNSLWPCCWTVCFLNASLKGPMLSTVVICCFQTIMLLFFC